MAITKTNFINYTRCKKYGSLENIHENKLTSDMTIEEYIKEEQDEQLGEILSSMFELNDNGEEIDKTIKKDKQLEVMMEYYK